MTTCRTIGIRAPLRTLLIAAGLTAGLSVAAAAAVGDALLSPTPLILKDGRIANVSVHIVAFAPGRSALDSAVAQDLRLLTEDVATDCFLTAQVIGHVGSSEVAGNDTLNAHRLARARADAVQASLIEGGLPAKAIASVWDWQFMVREARATLWVFRLTPGEDCEGAPLDTAAPALVAQAEPPPAPTTGVAPPAEARKAEAAPPSPEPVTTRPAIAATPAPKLSAPARLPSVTHALPAVSAAEPQESAKPAQTSPGTAATAELAPAPAVPAQSPPAHPDPAASQPAATPAAEVVAALPDRPAPAAAAAAVPAQPAAVAVAVKEERLAIVFPTNSSYFPPGTGSQLRSLLQALAADRRYEVVLESSVSGTQHVVGAETAEEAARYNKWLATRRLDRVQDWFAQHAAGDGLVIKPEYRADDDSRQVVIRIRPTG